MDSKEVSFEFETTVRRRMWEPPDDTYLAVDFGEQQVFEHNGWKEGDKVRIHITIEKIGEAAKAGDK